MAAKEEVLKVLEMLRDGKISQEEAERLLQVLERAAPAEPRLPETAPGREKPAPTHLDLGSLVSSVFKGLMAKRGGREADFEAECRNLESVSREEQLSMSVGAGGATEADLVWANMGFEGGEGDPGLKATLTAYGETAEKAAELLRSVSVRVEGEGSEWQVIPCVPNGAEGRVRFDLRFRVPRQCHITAKAVMGRLSATGVAGEVGLQAKRGEVSVCECEGEIETQCVTGTVSIEGCRGEITARAPNGDVVLDDCRGSITAKTTNGQVTIHDCGESVEAGSVNGSVKVTDSDGVLELHGVNGSIEAAGGRWGVLEAHTVNGPVRVCLATAQAPVMEIHTVNGQIDVSLPEGVSGRLEAKTVSGRVRCEHPLKESEVSARLLSGVLGSGGNAIELHAVNGAITVRKEG
jgi:hypothetical protein